MKKKRRVLTFVLAVAIGVAFATGGFAQSITEQVGKAGSDLMTKEKAKAAEEAIKDKATKPKDDKTAPAAKPKGDKAVPAAKPKPGGPAEKIVVNPFESPDTTTPAASPAQPAKAPPKAASPKAPAKTPSKTEKQDKAGAK